MITLLQYYLAEIVLNTCEEIIKTNYILVGYKLSICKCFERKFHVIYPVH